MPFNCFLDTFITQPEEVVDKELSKLKPLNYNKFMWWRTHSQPGVPLGIAEAGKIFGGNKKGEE